MTKISVYCGETIKSCEQLHPVLDVEKAIAIIESLKDEICYSNSPDFVMAIKWIGKKRGVETEFFLNGVSQGDSIEEIFEDFNRALDMINNLSGEEENNYCKDCINDYDDPQMCKFCKNGSHQTLGQ